MTCRAVLRVGITDVLVKAGFVGYVTTGELEDPFASQGMLQELLTGGALATDKGSISA